MKIVCSSGESLGTQLIIQTISHKKNLPRSTRGYDYDDPGQRPPYGDAEDHAYLGVWVYYGDDEELKVDGIWKWIWSTLGVELRATAC